LGPWQRAFFSFFFATFCKAASTFICS
jgi:hypothetical protein